MNILVIKKKLDLEINCDAFKLTRRPDHKEKIYISEKRKKLKKYNKKKIMGKKEKKLKKTKT